MERILVLLRERVRVSLTDLFTPPQTRGRLLGLFLAVLELMKARKIEAEQPDAFGDLYLRLAEPASMVADDAAPQDVVPLPAAGPQ
jgi:chromatin segregation and condensation protein Rec8/ScpA/Scc1 (kleisin family)